MKKVYQTIINKDHGNCMQAAFASLFEKEIHEVPNFIELEGEWFKTMYNFIKSEGYSFKGTLHNPTTEPEGTINDFECLKQYKGVGGYFFAAVYSPKYYIKNDKNPVTHAVIVDKYLNIVHDVNPNNKNIKNYPEFDKIGYNGVIYVYIIEKP